ncbi:MAG: hypothetical protein JNN22_16620 [Rhodospirillales bacterium]|nr:hypothetical protein [Rhodospirillales bacterium]
MNSGMSTIGALPEAAGRALEAWRTLRGAAGAAPALADLAPAEIPRQLLPWLMTIRRLPDRQLVYGVVGEQMVEGHGENPRGKPFLYDAPRDVAKTRIELVHAALDRTAPFWVASRGVRARQWAHFGRLGLPTLAADGEALLVLFFRLAAADAPKEKIERVVWLD